MSDGDAARNVYSIRPREQLAEFVEMAATTVHDINNPLTFLVANMSVEDGHASALQKMVKALVALDDPAVNRTLVEFGAQDRLLELVEIIDDNRKGIARVHALTMQLREALKP